jgi:hypothetical protein
LARPCTSRGHIVPPCPAQFLATGVWTNFLSRCPHVSLCRSPPRCALRHACTLMLFERVRALAATPCRPICSRCRAYKRTPLALHFIHAVDLLFAPESRSPSSLFSVSWPPWIARLTVPLSHVAGRGAPPCPRGPLPSHWHNTFLVGASPCLCRTGELPP